MTFTFDQPILFKHCDPAGIVFYPRYFEIFNDCIEAFFARIGHPFHEILRAGGVPTVRIETEFLSPNRHGDMLSLSLHLTKLGRTSIGVEITGRTEGVVSCSYRSVMVRVGADDRPQPWSDAERAALRAYTKGDT